MARLRTQDLAINPATYTDATAPVASDSILVIAPLDADVVVRSGAGEADISILAGTERKFGGPISADGTVRRWPVGAVAVQVKSSAGAGPAKLIWE